MNATANITARPGFWDYLLLLTLAAIWGSSFLFIKIGVETIPPATLTAGRLVLAAAVMTGVALLARQSLPRHRRVWLLIAMAALFGNVLPFTLISWGEETVDSGVAAILMAVMPLTTVLLAHLFTHDESLTWQKAVGVCLGLLGLIILIGPAKLVRLGDDTVRQLAIAGAAFCYGVNALVTKHLIALPKRVLAAAITSLSAIIMIPASIVADAPWTIVPSDGSLFAMILLGLLHTAIATLIMFAIVRRQGASFFSQMNFLTPLVGVFLGAAILVERPPANAYIALAIVLAGIAVARGLRLR